MAFEQYATGDWSIGQLVDHLEEQGLRSNPRHRKTVPKVLEKSQVQRILRSRCYLGHVRYKGQEYEGQHDALIEQTFDRVQELLDSRRQSESRYRLHNHYLKGMLFCGRCQTRLYEQNITNRHGTTYPYFVCRGRSVENRCSMALPPRRTN